MDNDKPYLSDEEIYEGPDACRHCLGWKRIASGEEGASWKYWAELTPPSNIAVTMGIVRPVTCPTCNGSGKQPYREECTQ